jgi:hypothetical protein
MEIGSIPLAPQLYQTLHRKHREVDTLQVKEVVEVISDDMDFLGRAILWLDCQRSHHLDAESNQYPALCLYLNVMKYSAPYEPSLLY